MLRLVGSEYADRLRDRADCGARSPISPTSHADSLILVALDRIATTLDRMASGFPAQVRAGDGVPAPGGGVSIDEAVARWRDDLTARDCTAGSIDRMLSIVNRITECAGWSTSADVSYQSAVAFLAARRRQESPWSNATHDQAVSTLRTFGEFLRRSGVLLVNPLTDLQSVGALNPQGARALTVDQARALVACSIERHFESRRAKGCAPLYWTVLFLTGLRVSEAASMQWSDLDLDSEHPCIWTDPKWCGNKAGRRDRIPLHPELLELLTKYRSSRMYRPGAVLPMMPTVETWNHDRDAAGIPQRDGRKRKATRHSTRKSFITWLDALTIPRGLVSKLARHATTLAERVYVDHSDVMESEAIAQLGGVWPEKVEIFSIRTHKTVGLPPNGRYLESATFGKNTVPKTTQRILTGRPAIQALSVSSVAARPQGPGRSVGMRSSTLPRAASRKDSNGQVAPLSVGESPRDMAARALAHYLLSDADAAPSEEPADDRDHKEAV
jgi:integrase